MIPRLVTRRRSIRAFLDEPVPEAIVEALVEAACLAPAPHHSRPWRWAAVTSSPAKQRLAQGMGARWRLDLRGDGVDDAHIDALVAASHAKIGRAPLVLLGCLTEHGLDRYPDERRRRAELGMALLSLGAGVENLMLTATDLGYATCWVAAPIFCPDEAAAALDLEPEWSPQAMVLVGRPDPAYRPPRRSGVPLTEVFVTR